MQRLIARALLLVFAGVIFTPMLAAQISAHECCLRKARAHCGEDPDVDGLSRGVCPPSHQCCAWANAPQSARSGPAPRQTPRTYPLAAVHAPVAFAATAIYLAPHPGRSPPLPA
jgi:hypothetical protein